MHDNKITYHITHKDNQKQFCSESEENIQVQQIVPINLISLLISKNESCIILQLQQYHLYPGHENQTYIQWPLHNQRKHDSHVVIIAKQHCQ